MHATTCAPKKSWLLMINKNTTEPQAKFTVLRKEATKWTTHLLHRWKNKQKKVQAKKQNLKPTYVGSEVKAEDDAYVIYTFVVKFVKS